MVSFPWDCLEQSLNAILSERDNLKRDNRSTLLGLNEG